MERFEISGIMPTGFGSLWKADVEINTPEVIAGVEVGQSATLTVRFEYPDDGPAIGLIEAATRKAEECLASAVSVLAGRSASELLAEFRESVQG